MLGFSREFVLTNAQWTEAYDAVIKRDAQAAVGLFDPGLMRSSFGLGAVALLDRAGQVVGGGMVNSQGTAYAAVSSSLATQLAGSSVTSGRKACGVLAAAEGHYLFCSAPVVHDDGSGPAAGTLVTLKALDAGAIAKLGTQAGLSMSPAGGTAARDRRSAWLSDIGALTVQTRAADAQTMELIVAVPSVGGGAPLVLRPRSPARSTRRPHTAPSPAPKSSACSASRCSRSVSSPNTSAARAATARSSPPCALPPPTAARSRRLAANWRPSPAASTNCSTP